MKLNYIQISNILSFEYKSNINKADKIKFGNNLNILIGPNGVGKSNFLEILNQLFKNILYKPVQYNEDNIYNSRQNPQHSLNNTLTEITRDYSYLNDNRKSNSKIMTLKIALNLNDNDIANLKFLYTNVTDLNDILHRYSQLGNIFQTNFNITDFDSNRQIEFIYEDNSPINTPKRFRRINAQTNDCLNFIEKYLEYFEYLQNAITIGNNFENKTWSRLKETFALMGAYRNYSNFNTNYTIDSKEHAKTTELKTKGSGENTRGSNPEEPVAFTHVRKTLAFQFNAYQHEYGTRKAKRLIMNEPLVQRINSLLYSYLKIKLDINKLDPVNLNYTFSFIDDHNHVVEFGDLSAGQKAITHFIFSLYGYDIEKGLFIIDEPELHLHPQMQEKFLNIISKIKDDLDIQFIIVTHSPMFINATVINNTYRFTLKRDFTKVIHPRVTNAEAELVRILSYTNSIKIFFSKKVVLVEGDSDEYFYRRFYDYYKDLKNKDPELEFLYIVGKGSYDLWAKFLKKYGVKTYYIGDWDNVVNFGLLNQTQINRLTNTYRASIFSNINVNLLMNKGSSDRINMLIALDNYVNSQTPQGLAALKKMRDYMLIRYVPYSDLVQFIRNTNAIYTSLITNINQLYRRKIYILRDGELEDYLGINKGLDNVIDFCKNSFASWTANPINRSKHDELLDIFDKITL